LALPWSWVKTDRAGYRARAVIEFERNYECWSRFVRLCYLGIRYLITNVAPSPFGGDEIILSLLRIFFLITSQQIGMRWLFDG